MSVTKFSPAFAAAFFGVPCAHAQAETRLPELGVTASRDEAQGYSPLVTSTGAMTDTPLRDLPVSVVVISKEGLRARRAVPGRCGSQPVGSLTVRCVPATTLVRRASCQFPME